MSTTNLPISIISKENKKAILTSLFTEGVFVVRKDNRQVTQHHYLDIPNLHAMMILKSLHSKKYVSETYAWRYNYYTLTDAGLAYLRDYLHLSATEVPKTHKVAAVERAASRGPRGPRREGAAPRDGAARRGPRRDAPKAEAKEL